MNAEDMDQIAAAITLVIEKGEEGIEAAQVIVRSLTEKYPLS
jgi:hypothetical protein